MSKGGQQEVVMLFNTEGEVCEEMHFSTFGKYLAGKQNLESFAASVVKAAYVVVGNGLSVRGVVFFLFTVDEDGIIDPAFNLPLQYLVQQAGIGDDLGQGGIRRASRGQCPVPWHAVNLWDPDSESGVQLVQSRVFRNKLKLKNATECAGDDFFPAEEVAFELHDNNPCEDLDFQFNGNTLNQNNRSVSLESQDKNHELASKLNEVFGESGKLSLQELIRMHTEQLDQVKEKFRDNAENQKLSHLKQVRTCREEIHSLKVELRHEQGRNRRLQQMLRGDL